MYSLSSLVLLHAVGYVRWQNRMFTFLFLHAFRVEAIEIVLGYGKWLKYIYAYRNDDIFKYPNKGDTLLRT